MAEHPGTDPDVAAVNRYHRQEEARTWWAVKRSPKRLALRHEATAPVLAAVTAAGTFGRHTRPTRRWRVLVGVPR